MRILRVINTLGIGGAERSIVNNVPIHNQRGIKTEVLLLNGRESFFTDSLEKQGVKVVSLEKKENIKSIYNPLHVFKIIKYFKDYDIIHAHLFPSIYWVALAKFLSQAKVKLILTEHSTENRRRKSSKIIRFIEKKIYGLYDAIITITPEAKKNLENHLGRSNNIKMIYNGVDLNSFENVNSDYKFSIENIPNPYYLVQVASFRDQKDQKTLIKALKYLPNNIVAVFVGDGPKLKECMNLVTELNLNDRVKFLGLKKNIPEIMCAADIVVMSSIYEGFGRAAVEGMAARKPVIASNVKGLAKVVNEDRLLFEVGNDSELAKKILLLYENKALYNELSEICYKNAQKYSLETMIDEYEKVYKKVYTS